MHNKGPKRLGVRGPKRSAFRGPNRTLYHSSHSRSVHQENFKGLNRPWSVLQRQLSGHRTYIDASIPSLQDSAKELLLHLTLQMLGQQHMVLCLLLLWRQVASSQLFQQCLPLTLIALKLDALTPSGASCLLLIRTVPPTQFRRRRLPSNLDSHPSGPCVATRSARRSTSERSSARQTPRPS